MSFMQNIQVSTYYMMSVKLVYIFITTATMIMTLDSFRTYITMITGLWVSPITLPW